MGNLEFIYKINELNYKEQVALHFQNWRLFVSLLIKEHS